MSFYTPYLATLAAMFAVVSFVGLMRVFWIVRAANARIGRAEWMIVTKFEELDGRVRSIEIRGVR